MGISAYTQVKQMGISQREMEQKMAQNMPLVEKIAYHLKGRLPDSVMVEDLIQSGTIGLMEAIRNYDETQGAAFTTYAGTRIRGAMLDELRRGDWTPRSVHRKNRDMQKAISDVEAREGREARDHEIAAEMGIEMDEYFSIVNDSVSAHMLSIDEPDNDALAEDRMVSSSDGPLGSLATNDFQDDLAEVISGLPEKEKLIMSLYYDEELNLKEIGMVLDLSESRVSQLHGQALTRIRSRMKGWL